VEDLVIFAPVTPTRETALRSYLRALRESPLARLPIATHFARWVILPLDGPRLLFSSRFDGDAGRYLDALAGLEEAAAIWSNCESEDDLHEPAKLRAFLSDHRVESPYILPAWPTASVEEVNQALDLRAELSRFAVEAQALDPVGLAHAFRERFAR
jgi:hypothetical protein